MLITEQCDSGEQSEELPSGLVVDGGVVPGGGDSLFISLHRTMTNQGVMGTPKSMLLLREVLVDELLKSPERYGFNKLNKTKRKELKLMRYLGQLPNLEVLLAASRLYKLKIMVYLWSSQPIMYVDTKSELSTFTIVNLQCLAGIHFNALRSEPNYVSFRF